MKKNKSKKIYRFFNRIFGFFLLSGIILGFAALGLEYILVKGPSDYMKSYFNATMLETRRFKFVPYIFQSESEVFLSTHKVDTSPELPAKKEATDIAEQDLQENDDGTVTDSYGYTDDDGDGVVKVEVHGKGFSGFMLIVWDPSQVIVGVPETWSGAGETLLDICNRYGAIAGINAGGFEDEGGQGNGNQPGSAIVYEGNYFGVYNGVGVPICGITEDGAMLIDAFSIEDCENYKIRNGSHFGPVLIWNGTPNYNFGQVSGVNPRTVIGQRADGAILMLVIDGRQTHSLGCSYEDLIDVLLDFDCIQADNMDGGSSTCMAYYGEIINVPSSQNGPRRLPCAWLVMPKKS